jgi:hypothetical protein
MIKMGQLSTTEATRTAEGHTSTSGGFDLESSKVSSPTVT